MQLLRTHLAVLVVAVAFHVRVVHGHRRFLDAAPPAPLVALHLAPLIRGPLALQGLLLSPGRGLHVRLDQAAQLGQLPVTLGQLAPEPPDLLHGPVHHSPASGSGPFSTRLAICLSVLASPLSMALISHFSHRPSRVADKPPQPGGLQVHPVVITRLSRVGASKWRSSSTGRKG